ncbi:DUF6350 family protein [Kitasatospora sp. NPDC050543]|uniref:cell division protein PerM n=1 Tax=Kitasatospora sp. NPDC050543 TaxID=3364054 RepID=UPI0037B87315
MTQLMGRPILDLPSELGARRFRGDLLAGVRAALLGLAVVGAPILGLWVVTPYADDTAAGAVRLAGALWLLGHGGPLARGDLGSPMTVTPLLTTVLLARQLYRAGTRLGARSAVRAPWWRAPLALCGGYLAVAVVVALECADYGALRARVLADLAAVAVLAAGAVGAGAWSVRRPEENRPVVHRLPPTRIPAWARPPGCRRPVRLAAAAWAYGLLAGGATVVATAAVLDGLGGGRSAPVAGGGPAGVLGLLLLSVALLPNAVCWGAAYALGPGFAVGTGTVVAPTGATLGPVPDLPLFALLPEPGAGGWRLLACALPPLAAVVPVLLLGRAAAGRRDVTGEASMPCDVYGTGDVYGTDIADVADAPEGVSGAGGAEPWRPAATVVAVLATALLVGAGTGACGWLCGGALAAGRMARLGPVPWQLALAAGGWFAASGVPGALLVRWALVCGRPVRPARWYPARPDRGWAAATADRLARWAVVLRARAYRVVLRAGESGVIGWIGRPAARSDEAGTE